MWDMAHGKGILVDMFCPWMVGLSRCSIDSIRGEQEKDVVFEIRAHSVGVPSQS